jgi:truncated hemoglobin YjbI
MSLTKSFRQKVRAVRIRCSINLFLRHAGRVLMIGGGIFALATLIERLFAVPVLVSWAIWAFGGAAAAVLLLLWLLGLPSRMQASLLLDERLKLHERFSTTLALARCDDPFAVAARDESMQRIQRANLRGHFPIGLSRSWYYGMGIWVVAIGLLLYMPQKDLLGFLKKQRQQQEQTQQLADAQTEVKEAMEPVKTTIKELHNPALEKELEKLDELAKGGDPQELKREAIKMLGDLSERIKQMQGGAQMEAGDILQRMLRQLHGSTEPFSQQIRMAMAKGDFSQAANLLRQLQKQLTEGALSDQQRQQMAEQLQQLAKELQKLSAQQRELEEEMEKLGLDKKLAQMGEQQLRQTLQQQGLKPEQIEQLLQKMAASQAAAGRCSGLAQAMAASGQGAGGLSADELSGAIEQLDALESLEQQALQLQAGLSELSRCMGSLGEGMCDSIGGQSPFAEGNRNEYGSGSGGPGQGFGPRDSDTEGQFGTKTTRVTGKSDQGPVIAGWYFKDTQVKGEARRDFSEVVEAGRARAADAISENQIPRKYEEAVKKYFGQLDQQAPKQ